MSASGAFLPGIFSQVGRTTAFDIDSLKMQLHLEHTDEPLGSDGVDNQDLHSKASTKTVKSKFHSKGQAATSNQDELKPRTPGGELARAIQEKLFSAGIEVDQAPVDAKPDAELLTSSFVSEGKDGRWATKHSASNDISALNRRGEEHPAPGWYKVKHESVLHRQPCWDIGDHSKTQSRPRPGDAEDASMMFLTGIDPSNEEDTKALTARQRAMLRDVLGLSAADNTQGKVVCSAMALASERGDLGKIGRNHVLGNEVTCAHDSDLLVQDIKGYPKLRYPEWDFNAYSARKPLIPEDALGEPGKYDANLDSVKAVPKNGVSFGKALPRSVCVSTMGYSAPIAALHPESKRTRGLLPDRSTAKNSVRRRVTHVNDFDREMARPPLLTGAAKVYHDESDPKACAMVHHREMMYDASVADIPVTHRRDITGAQYSRMLGRGRDAVQGLRGCASDLGVRGSVGLGFIETETQRRCSVEQLEARASAGSKANPNRGPTFAHTALNEHTASSERIFRGKYPVKSGVGVKNGPLKRTCKDHPMVLNRFQRSVSHPGFESHTRLGGTRDVLGRNRTSVPVDDW
eukprot:CAMPEP_0169102588 /NCGR_PEP_ID=MMETSP1015-20121227/22248_1 /TAXON_ID=342587 /ORGANISM="Karlodinium micrum, Strain CCMP2283" /LENGTH=574 /DNA_ID=CAMNT_0009163701 /DNA_START=140 /DNA_END=1861 /DNA_ORIENTATION=-